MAAKLREKDGSYWVVVHYQGRRKWKKIGKDKREALKVVHMVNAQLAVGSFSMGPNRKTPTVEEALRRWYEDYRPTFSPSYAHLAEIHIRCHLIPFFGSLRLDELSEKHLLQFISSAKSTAKNPKAKSFQMPLSAGTLKNILSTLRRVIGIAVEDGQITKNPCRNMGRLLSKVKRQRSGEVEQVSAWSRAEVTTLLDVAKEEEPTFHPLLSFLLSTGCRRGEALALKWEDIDFGDARISIRRSVSRGRLGTPKSGKARSVVLSPALSSALSDLLDKRRRECLKHGWASVPEFVFCSETGGLLNARNVGRSWDRLRRKAQAHGVRPLRLHDARHTFASLAMAAGKSVRWVSSQLGHASPELTLRVYAHAMREEETDLSFLDFGGTKRHPGGTKRRAAAIMSKPVRTTPREIRKRVVTRARFERATPSFGDLRANSDIP